MRNSCRMQMPFLPTIFMVMSYLAMSIMAALPSAAPLKEGFYGKSCPSAERIVRDAVKKAVSANPGIAAGLIRLHFHDCFVRGCDASILLDSKPRSKPSEKESIANGKSLRGMEVINEAKAKIEAQCPKTVSCADILAFAARDSSSIVGGISYPVPAGRRDGRVSLKSEVLDNLPPPVSDVGFINTFFQRKGMSITEMVALTGAHSIGRSHCGAFTSRLYSFNMTSEQDPSREQDPTLDPKFASFLKTKCPNPSTSRKGQNITANLDLVTPNRLDAQYYVNLKKKAGLLASDQALESSPLTATTVNKYIRNPTLWAKDYAAAMLHMGSIDVVTGAKGEIRQNCRVVN